MLSLRFCNSNLSHLLMHSGWREERGENGKRKTWRERKKKKLKLGNCEEKRKRKRKRRKKKTEEKNEKNNTNKMRKKSRLAASHPSVKGQRPQERWIGAHWESQEANPLPSYRLSASVRITGYRRSDCRRGRQESIYMCSERPNTPPRLPAKTVFKFNI